MEGFREVGKLPDGLSGHATDRESELPSFAQRETRLLIECAETFYLQQRSTPSMSEWRNTAEIGFPKLGTSALEGLAFINFILIVDAINSRIHRSDTDDLDKTAPLPMMPKRPSDQARRDFRP
ncbi:MAG: hypothetical protein ABSD72_07075 [Terracidiphilus sp.]|jgi:hypothetical protein